MYHQRFPDTSIDLQTAYIRLFGAAALAFGALDALGDKMTCPELLIAKQLLHEALSQTDGIVDLK